jgi:hypothetical protein
MTMNKSPRTRSKRAHNTSCHDSLSEAGQAELEWFFNQAEIDIDLPSNYQALIGGACPSSVQEVERRAEAIHAARKIHERLQRLRSTDMLILSGLYTERPWSDAVQKALPDGLAGAAAASPSVRIEYVRALAGARTGAQNVATFIEEVVKKGRRDLLAEWRNELAVAAAIAMTAYERVRGSGPSVVPEAEG